MNVMPAPRVGFVAWVRANATWLQGLTQAGLALGMGFGLHLTVEQMGDILAFTAILFGVAAHVGGT